jgi:quinol monooxygenase YgiN
MEGRTFMITVNILYTGKGDSAIKFSEEMIEKGIVEKIKLEEGNLRYEYFTSLEDKNSILLVDTWKDEKSIDLHHKSEMMKVISKLRKKYQLKMKVTKFKEI